MRLEALVHPPYLAKQLNGYLAQAQNYVVPRMNELGYTPYHFNRSQLEEYQDRKRTEVFDRSIYIITASNESALRWHASSLASDRLREEEMNPDVGLYMINCIDGRIFRILDGSIHSTKSEKSQIALTRHDSGLLVPSTREVAETIMHPTKKVLEFVRIHDHCKAMDLLLTDYSNEVWGYLEPWQVRLINQAAQQSPELANYVLAEFGTRAPIENLHELSQGRRERIAIVSQFNIKSTSVDFINPVVVPDGSGGFRLAKEDEQSRFSTSEIAQKLIEIQRRSKSSLIPEPGKFKDKYKTPDGFEEYSKTHTNLWVGLMNMKIRTEDQAEVELPSEFEEVRKIAISAVERLYPDLDDSRKRASVHKKMRAGIREYLIEESGNDNHQEICITGAKHSNYIGKYWGERQTLRMGIPDDESTAESRIIIGSAVMDGNGVDMVSGERRQHILLLSDSTRAGTLELFAKIVRQPGVKALVDRGILLPIPAVVTSNIIATEIPQEAANFLRANQ